MSGITNYPNADVKSQYVGRLLQDIDGPLAVIDRVVAKRNCQVMLDTADELGVLFRAHVKTHKTTEITRYQVGEKSDTVRLVVSTLAEAEQLQPFLEECRQKDRAVDVIYGLPVQPSCFSRLAALGTALGEGSITCLVDSTEILPYLSKYHELTGQRLGVFIKLDTGHNRAGILPDSPQFVSILEAVYKLETDSPHLITLRGFYSHLGRSYGSDSPTEAMDYLEIEIDRCTVAAKQATALPGPYSTRRFIIAVGATPTTTSAQNLTGPRLAQIPGADKAKALIDQVQEKYDIELHAGAYTTLDMQQLAAHARPSPSNLSYDDLALTVLAEVGSLYPHREKPEALIACGQLCMGREPCRSYPGWGVVTPWQHTKTDEKLGWYDPEGEKTGWMIDRLSQEHGILAWQGPVEKMRQLKIGEKIRVWPNHCCICCAGFSFLLVVDSSLEGIEKDRVVDVWHSWRGW
ncbi:hypothetical protein FQN57_003841 [Myotisia sp. PD_48]|nr:hypothetical protein FQN57_003841 [Myotisia sp. PD_48]